MTKTSSPPVRPEDYSTVFGKVVRPLMKALKLTAKEVAELAGVSRMSFHRYLNGERFPSQATAKAVAQVLDSPNHPLEWAEFEQRIVTRERYGISPPLRIKGKERMTAGRKRYEDYSNRVISIRTQAQILGVKQDMPLYIPDYFNIPQGGFADAEDVNEIMKEMQWPGKYRK